MSRESIMTRHEINYTSNIIHQIYGRPERDAIYILSRLHHTCNIVCNGDLFTNGTTYSETAFNFFHYFETPFKYHARRDT